MPMWITWINPKTQKRERIYNYHDVGSPEGSKAINVAKSALSTRFGVHEEQIPAFRVESAGWISTGNEDRSRR